MQSFKPDWEDWINSNVLLGNCKRIMFQKSLDAGYSYELIKNKLNIDYDISETKNTKKIALLNSKKLNARNLDIYVIEDFLNQDECDKIISIINLSELAKSSTYDADSPNVLKINNFRTSKTCYFLESDELINNIESRISRTLGINNRFSEKIQGQKYEIGEEFKLHSDYFDPLVLNENKSINGQRTWTFMIYLNNVEKGGYTSFPDAFVSIKPIMGTAVIWNNLNEINEINVFSKHRGMPILHGNKYILTKWFKETENLFNVKNQICDHHFLPIFHPIGFEKISIKMDSVKEIISWMNNNESQFIPEKLTNTELESRTKSRILNIQNAPKELLSKLKKEFKSLLTKWIDYKTVLKHTSTYGIREYLRGSILENHYDKYNTHIISAIIHISDVSDTPWKLYIEDHMFRPHEITMHYGDILLYESTTCLHGRRNEFEGDSYRNMYIHFKPKNW